MEPTIDMNFGTNISFKNEGIIFWNIFLGGPRIIILCIISQITISKKNEWKIKCSFSYIIKF